LKKREKCGKIEMDDERMDNEKRIKSLKEKDYQKYFGVTKATFDKMLKYWKQSIEMRIKTEADHLY